jgi:c-di-GMP-binding flagellar brake protein YcgR
MNMEKTDGGFEEHRAGKRASTPVTVLYTVRAPFAVRIRIGDSDCSALAQDIGEGGMGLLVNRDLPIDSLLALKFTILNDLEPKTEERRRIFELDAQVRSCLLIEKIDYRLGVRFVSILEPDRVYIARYVKSNALSPQPNPSIN